MTFRIAAALCLAAVPAFAQEGDQLSQRIGEIGIRPAIAELEAAGDLAPDQRFVLGGLYFLGAAERALQLRYAYGIDQTLVMMTGIPFLRLPIPENPTPQPLDPAAFETLFADATGDLARAIEILDTIGDADDFGTKIDTGNLWLDINANGTREPGEGVAEALGSLQRFQGGALPDVTVRFDTADAAWLSAYAHLLSGFAEVVVALHPTERIGAVLADTEALAAFGTVPGKGFFTDGVDMVTALIGAIETQPDPDHSRAAHAHFLAMIRDNRTFWARVAAETDNAAEWIPNAAQTTALPLTFPPQTAEVWGEVLSEAEEVLEGRRLIRHWRMDFEHGVNLRAFMENPPELDVIGMIQGRTFLPYIERGPVMDGAALRRFEAMMSGQAGLFMVLLN